MGLLERFEDSLDRIVNGAFARAFKAEVQPVEIASALQREISDRAAVIDRNRTVIPNVFHVELSEHDYKRLAVFKDALQTELATLVRDYGAEQRYTLLGPVQVTAGAGRRARDRHLPRAQRGPRRGQRAAARHARRRRRSSVDARQPRLEVGGTAYPLVRAITRLGRGSDTDIRIEDPGRLAQPLRDRPRASPSSSATSARPTAPSSTASASRRSRSPTARSIMIGSTQLVFRSG